MSVRHLDAEVIGPCPCQLLGYRGMFTLVDRNTGDVTGISLDATEAEARQLVPHGAL